MQRMSKCDSFRSHQGKLRKPVEQLTKEGQLRHLLWGHCQCKHLKHPTRLRIILVSKETKIEPFQQKTDLDIIFDFATLKSFAVLWTQ